MKQWKDELNDDDEAVDTSETISEPTTDDKSLKSEQSTSGKQTTDKNQNITKSTVCMSHSQLYDQKNKIYFFGVIVSSCNISIEDFYVMRTAIQAILTLRIILKTPVMLSYQIIECQKLTGVFRATGNWNVNLFVLFTQQASPVGDT